MLFFLIFFLIRKSQCQAKALVGFIQFVLYQLWTIATGTSKANIVTIRQQTGRKATIIPLPNRHTAPSPPCFYSERYCCCLTQWCWSYQWWWWCWSHDYSSRPTHPPLTISKPSFISPQNTGFHKDNFIFWIFLHASKFFPPFCLSLSHVQLPSSQLQYLPWHQTHHIFIFIYLFYPRECGGQFSLPVCSRCLYLYWCFSPQELGLVTINNDKSSFPSLFLYSWL